MVSKRPVSGDAECTRVIRKMTYFVGIDVSKAKLDCLWLREVQARKVKTKVLGNDDKGHRDLMDWLIKNTASEPGQIRVVMEATGIYHEKLALALYAHGFQVCVVNPAQI